MVFFPVEVEGEFDFVDESGLVNPVIEAFYVVALLGDDEVPLASFVVEARDESLEVGAVGKHEMLEARVVEDAVQRAAGQAKEVFEVPVRVGSDGSDLAVGF